MLPILILAESKIVELLCNRPIDIDLKDNQGVTPLMIAAKNGTNQMKQSPTEEILFKSKIIYRKTAHS